MQTPHAKNGMELQEHQEEGNILCQLLDSAVDTVPYLGVALQAMHRHLSIHNAWETLAGHLGLSTKQVAVYASLIPANPSRLPSETFFLHFSNESCLSLRELLGALLAMAEQDPHCRFLVQNLLEAAWNGYLKQHPGLQHQQ